MLKQTTVYNVSSHLHAKLQKCHLKVDAVSACSIVPGYNTFSFVQRTNVVHSCLERCPSLSLKRAPVGGRRFRPGEHP